LLQGLILGFGQFYQALHWLLRHDDLTEGSKFQIRLPEALSEMSAAKSTRRDRISGRAIILLSSAQKIAMLIGENLRGNNHQFKIIFNVFLHLIVFLS